MLVGLPFSLQLFPVTAINSLYRLNETERNVNRPFLLFSDYPEDGSSKLFWKGGTCTQYPLLHIQEDLTHFSNDVVDRTSTSLNKQGYDKQNNHTKRRRKISEYTVIRHDRRKDIKIN